MHECWKAVNGPNASNDKCRIPLNPNQPPYIHDHLRNTLSSATTFATPSHPLPPSPHPRIRYHLRPTPAVTRAVFPARNTSAVASAMSPPECIRCSQRNVTISLASAVASATIQSRVPPLQPACTFQMTEPTRERSSK